MQNIIIDSLRIGKESYDEALNIVNNLKISKEYKQILKQIIKKLINIHGKLLYVLNDLVRKSDERNFAEISLAKNAVDALGTDIENLSILYSECDEYISEHSIIESSNIFGGSNENENEIENDNDNDNIEENNNEDNEFEFDEEIFINDLKNILNEKENITGGNGFEELTEETKILKSVLNQPNFKDINEEINVIIKGNNTKQITAGNNTEKENIIEKENNNNIKKKGTIIYVYNPDCIHCKLFNNTWEELKKKYNKYFKFDILNITEYPEERLKKILNKYNVKETPTLILIQQNPKNPSNNNYKIFSNSVLKNKYDIYGILDEIIVS